MPFSHSLFSLFGDTNALARQLNLKNGHCNEAMMSTLITDISSKENFFIAIAAYIITQKRVYVDHSLLFANYIYCNKEVDI